MSKRETLLKNVTQLLQNFFDDEEPVQINSMTKYWLSNTKFQYLLSKAHSTLIINRRHQKSQLHHVTGANISKQVVRYLFVDVISKAENVFNRLVYMVENVYQFFVNILVEYAINIGIRSGDRFTLQNCVEFFTQRVQRFWKNYHYVECLTSIGVPECLQRITNLSFTETLRRKARIRDVAYNTQVAELLFTTINEALSWAANPMIGQFQPNVIDDYSWNVRLCECLEDLNRLLYESYSIAELPNWFVNATRIDPDITPHYATTTKRMRDLWNIINYMGVADNEADTCGAEMISTVDDKRLTEIYQNEVISNWKTKLLDKEYGGSAGDKDDLDAYYEYENNDFSEDDKSSLYTLSDGENEYETDVDFNEDNTESDSCEDEAEVKNIFAPWWMKEIYKKIESVATATNSDNGTSKPFTAFLRDHMPHEKSLALSKNESNTTYARST